jgi:anaerobic glycerol-3-phosphate dehydrogenase
MNTSKMKMVKLKNSAKTHHTTESIIDVIVQNVCAIPNYEKLKNDPELFRYILTLLENGIIDQKIDKKELIDKIVTRLFPTLTNEEQVLIEGVINFVINNELVQKIGCLSVAKKWFKSQFLGVDPVKKA